MRRTLPTARRFLGALLLALLAFGVAGADRDEPDDPVPLRRVVPCA